MPAAIGRSLRSLRSFAAFRRLEPLPIEGGLCRNGGRPASAADGGRWRSGPSALHRCAQRFMPEMAAGGWTWASAFWTAPVLWRLGWDTWKRRTSVVRCRLHWGNLHTSQSLQVAGAGGMLGTGAGEPRVAARSGARHGLRLAFVPGRLAETLLRVALRRTSRFAHPAAAAVRSIGPREKGHTFPHRSSLCRRAKRDTPFPTAPR